MLTTNKTSRSRLIGGAAAIAMIGVAGLGLTASGTKAAETVRAKMEKATGMSLAKFEVAPPAAAAPLGAAQVAEPPVPPAPPESANLPPIAPGEDRDIDSSTTTENGKIVKRIKVVVRDKDGKVRTEDWRGMDELKNMPEVSSANCPSGDAKQMVINEKRGGKQRIIICTNRIEKVASDGARMAANSKDIQRNALQTAIASLRATRASMEANKDMPAEGRAEAIKGIDEAIAEVTAEMSKAD